MLSKKCIPAIPAEKMAGIAFSIVRDERTERRIPLSEGARHGSLSGGVPPPSRKKAKNRMNRCDPCAEKVWTILDFDIIIARNDILGNVLIGSSDMTQGLAVRFDLHRRFAIARVFTDPPEAGRA